MKATEILRIGRELLKVMSEFDLRVNDYEYIGMLAEYNEMRRNGDKVDFILAVLADRYKVSESTVKRIVRRLSREVKA